MTKTKKVLLIGTISIVSLTSLIAFSGHSRHFGGFGPMHGMHGERFEFIVDRMSNKLDLSEVQRQSLRNIRETIKANKAAHREGDPSQLLKSLLSEPVLDEARVLAEFQTRADNIEAAAPAVISAIAEFTNSLNDKQRAKILSKVEQFSEHRRAAMDQQKTN